MMTTAELLDDLQVCFGRLPDIIGKPYSEGEHRDQLLGFIAGGLDLTRDRIAQRAVLNKEPVPGEVRRLNDMVNALSPKART